MMHLQKKHIQIFTDTFNPFLLEGNDDDDVIEAFIVQHILF